MVSLFLVEDEIVMRDGIKKHIDWEKEGIVFAGEASDGELAYPMILKLKPDILVTDIKMPFMDGLQLSELVKKELPDINIIILSGYDEFTYAQKAVSLGVTEYLLKPITPAALLSSIKNLKDKIEEQRRLAAEAEWSSMEAEEKNDIARMKLFEALIMNSLPVPEMLTQAKELNVNLTAMNYRIARLFFGLKGESSDAYSETRNEFRKGLSDIISKSYPSSCMVDRGMDGFIILITGSDEDVNAGAEAFLKEAMALAESFKDSRCFIGVGCVVNRISEIKNTYFEASKAFSQRFLDPSDRIVYYSEENEVLPPADEKETTEDLFRLAANDQSHKALETFLKTGTYDEADPFMEGVFAAIGDQNLNSGIFLNYVTMDCYFIMMRFLSGIGADPEELLKDSSNINSVLKEMKNSRDSLDFLKKCLKEAISIRDRGSAKKYGRLLHDALNYIDENFDREDISLNTVSSVANISPNHFSAIFSQEMGVTFIEYLIGKRMEKAKELLMTTDLKSSEIAYQVGYKDPHYFSYTFKKTQKMTAREYRLRGRKENE